MRRELYPSLEAMLAPAALSGLAGRQVTESRRVPFDSAESYSGSCLQLVETDPAGERYILKRISAHQDWIMRATSDHRGRSVSLWQAGIMDCLPVEIAHGVLACSVDGAGWAILMCDFSAVLIPNGDSPITVAQQEQLLNTMAALHADFWEQPALADDTLGLCSLLRRYTFLAPGAQPKELRRTILDGWQLLEALVEPGAASVIRRLLDDPQPLCAAQGRWPQTLVHGDWKLANLGLEPGIAPRVVLLDWALVGAAPAAVDLAWYLAINSARLAVSREAATAHYEQALARRLGRRFDRQWWQPQLELSLLGAFLQLGWAKLFGAARAESAVVRDRELAEVAWWTEHVRAAARWL
jgi:hypothetical protein